MNKPPKNATKHCLSVDCPERRSVCCEAKPKTFNKPEGGGYFICSKCGNQFEGGKCSAPDLSIEPLKDPRLCNFMIMTPTPLHNGGMWCAEPYPCKRHGKWREDNPVHTNPDHVCTPACDYHVVRDGQHIHLRQTFKLVDYKGKFTIAHDPEKVDDLDEVVGEITRSELIMEAANRKLAAEYYGVPAIVTDDVALNMLFGETK